MPTQAFNFTGAQETFVVPANVCSVTVTAIGASGGSFAATGQTSRTGGLGASLQGDFTVTPGETLTILVGGAGGNSSVTSAGGGGGSFVWRTATLNAATLLAAAGGGGGAGDGANGQNAVLITSATAGLPGTAPASNGLGGGGGTAASGGVGGTAGTGGSGAQTNGTNGVFGGIAGGGGGGGGALFDAGGGGGAGISGDGGRGGNGGNNSVGGFGGVSIQGGGGGGGGGGGPSGLGSAGGFGGGGGSGGVDGGAPFSGGAGGGGGYSGGGGGGASPSGIPTGGGGGGGGSLNNGTNQINGIAATQGNGVVTITFAVGSCCSISCPPDMTVFAPMGSGGTNVTYPNPTLSGDCTGVTASCTPPSGSFFPVGTTPVTCSAIRDGIVISTCGFDITVQETAIPCTIICPANIRVTAPFGESGTVVDFPPPTTSGACGSVTCSPSSGSFFPIGTTVVTCTPSVTSTPPCTFTINVDPGEAPTPPVTQGALNVIRAQRVYDWLITNENLSFTFNFPQLTELMGTQSEVIHIQSEKKAEGSGIEEVR